MMRNVSNWWRRRGGDRRSVPTVPVYGADVVIAVNSPTQRRAILEAVRERGIDSRALPPSMTAGATNPNAPTVLVISSGRAPGDVDLVEATAGRRRRANDRAVHLVRVPLGSHEVAAIASQVEHEVDRAIDESIRQEAQSQTERDFLWGVERARREDEQSSRTGVFAVIDVAERSRVRELFGAPAVKRMMRAVEASLVDIIGKADLVGHDSVGRIELCFSDMSSERVTDLLERGAQLVATHVYRLGDEELEVTPLVGWVDLKHGRTAVAVRDRAIVAAEANRDFPDLHPMQWVPTLSDHLDTEPSATTDQTPNRAGQFATAFAIRIQTAGMLAIGLLLPLVIVAGMSIFGIHIASYLFDAVLVALIGTAAYIYYEHLQSLDDVQAPELPEQLPTASAIIAAYLPNESATILGTIHAFQALSYPNLQIVLAYNTPHPMPVEALLRDLAAEDPRLRLLQVDGSTSKAQNINAALAVTTGEVIGIFDADHHPAPDAFDRAARWLCNGWDVVQGHCVVRNGNVSTISKLVAVEFESMYSVNHPGRAKISGFGIFGGSNGFWRSEVLNQIRMRAWMLTEDIDSTMRALLSGAKIASDPRLLSYELAPTTHRALQRQRLRWAQGWTQVSIAYFGEAMRSKVLTRKQKVGMFYLLGWRELYPWVAWLAWPMMAAIALGHGLDGHFRWNSTFNVVTAMITLGVSPVQAIWAYSLSERRVGEHRRWFVAYALLAWAYTEWKNAITRIGHLKELCGEHIWNVTPRDGESADTTTEAAQPERNLTGAAA